MSAVRIGNTLGAKPGGHPGGEKHIEGGFALFVPGRDSGSFTFYNSDAIPLGKGAVKLY